VSWIRQKSNQAFFTGSTYTVYAKINTVYESYLHQVENMITYTYRAPLEKKYKQSGMEVSKLFNNS